jgi:hypothetical protein
MGQVAAAAAVGMLKRVENAIIVLLWMVNIQFTIF